VARTAGIQACSPFALTLEICAIGPGGVNYGAPSASSTPNAQPVPVPAVTGSTGSTWGYVAIGAATLLLVAIGVGGLRVATNNRARPARG
jgi:hypothetical protein